MVDLEVYKNIDLSSCTYASSKRKKIGAPLIYIMLFSNEKADFLKLKIIKGFEKWICNIHLYQQGMKSLKCGGSL